MTETDEFEHLWPLYDDSAYAMERDLHKVRMQRLYSGAPQSVLGDVYLAGAITKAEEILDHLKAAQARRADLIDMHEKGAFWLGDVIG